jgi:hypothetical protein
MTRTSPRRTLPKATTERTPSHCAFCFKPQDQVRLIGGPNGIFICEECVSLCVEVLNEVPGDSEVARMVGRDTQISALVSGRFAGGQATSGQRPITTRGPGLLLRPLPPGRGAPTFCTRT